MPLERPLHGLRPDGRDEEDKCRSTQAATSGETGRLYDWVMGCASSTPASVAGTGDGTLGDLCPERRLSTPACGESWS